MIKKNVDTQRYVLFLFVFLISGGFLYALRSVLLPFVVGIVLAYFLDPLVSKVSKNGSISRMVATTVVMGISLLILLPLVVLLCSAVVSQAAEYVAKLPEYARSFSQRLLPILGEIKARFGFSYDNVESALQENMANYIKILGKVLQSIVSNGFAFINVLSLLLISPVVAFYMLRDWHLFTAKIQGLIPQKHKQTVLDGMQEVNRIISGYLRGQALVCLCLGSYYSLGLWLVGLEMGVVVGFIAGVISFIPYVGSISGFLMAMALVITQYGTMPKIIAVLIVFGIGQFLEGNFLTPKLVGENIGLHPVWVMFALLAGGVLLGLLGMIIAVPCAAIIGVLLKYLIKNYKQSPMYLDN